MIQTINKTLATLFLFLFVFQNGKLAGAPLFEPDTIKKENIIYTGNSVNGVFQGLWIGKDTKTDSIKYLAVFSNGHLIRKYYLNKDKGPLLMQEVSPGLDTLKTYLYENNGNIKLVSIYFAADTSLWRKNEFSASTYGESALKLKQSLQYIENYAQIKNLHVVRETNYGVNEIEHFYCGRNFVCLIDTKTKCVIKGNRKRYKKIMGTKQCQ